MSLPLASCTARASVSETARDPSYALPPRPGTIARSFEAQIKANKPKSGFRLIATGTDAFLTRIALVQSTQYSLDLQYYIVEDDLTGQILLEEILRAADRGVRVRLLIDHLTLPKVDNTLAVLNAHPNIEIRGFNPPATKGQPFWNHALAWVTDLDRVTRRMHNKVLIMDNVIAITGGRNLGDEYFDASSDFMFSDMDVMAVGPIVPRMSTSFDKYWNSNEAYPLHALAAPTPNDRLISEVRARLKNNWESVANSERGKVLRRPQVLTHLATGQIPLHWAQAELSVDEPEKIEEPVASAESIPFMRLDRLTEQGKEEFLAVSPYFVPREEGLAWFKSMIDRGMRVRVLTNSLASTDVAAVHAGYMRYRDELLKMGVELYEFKPIPGARTRSNIIGKSGSRSSLHSKIYVVDRKHVVIGSFNLDPRSIELNTELVIVIHSEPLAQEVARLFEDTAKPTASFQLMLTEEPREKMLWVTEEKGKKQIYGSDPSPGVWRGIQTFFFSLLPIEDQL